MREKINKRFAIIVSTLIVGSSLATAGFASDNLTNFKGVFSDIKIFSNNKQVQLDVKPFIMDNTTYVPVRALSNVLNKDINWDGGNNRIDITDKQEQDINYMLQQMVQRQQKITELESKVKELEAKLASVPNYSLSDLEKKLNNNYDVYKKVKFSLDLSGNKDNIKVGIFVNLNNYGYEWDALTNSEIKSYVQNVVDDIKYEFKDASVSGYIEDTVKDKDLITFSITSKGSLSISNKSDSGYKDSYDLRSMERHLDNKYYNYKGTSVSIKLYEDRRDYIQVNINLSESDWNYLTSKEQQDLIYDVHRDVSYEFSYATVDVYVYDGNYKLDRY